MQTVAVDLEWLHGLVAVFSFIVTWSFIVGVVALIFFFGVWAWYLIGQSRGWQ